MKIFTAEEFNKSPKKVFREADKNGIVKINHNNYDDKVFYLESRDRHSGVKNK